MRARSIPLGSMFAWIPSTFRLVLNHIGTMVIAGLLSFAVVMACYLPLFAWLGIAIYQNGMAGMVTAQQGATYWTLYGLSVAAGLLVMGPMLAGWMRLCAAADRGEVVSGMQVFSVLQEPRKWGQLLLLALLAGVVVLFLGGLAYLAFGDVFRLLMRVQEAQQAAMLRGSAPPPPDMHLMGQVFRIYVVVLPVLMLLQLAYSIAVADIGLHDSSAFGAFRESVNGVLRNLVKFIAFAICLFIFAMVCFILLGLLLFLVVGALMLVSKVLGTIVGIVVYIGALLLMYPLLFASNFYVWKDMLGEDAPPDPNAVAL